MCSMIWLARSLVESLPATHTHARCRCVDALHSTPHASRRVSLGWRLLGAVVLLQMVMGLLRKCDRLRLIDARWARHHVVLRGARRICCRRVRVVRRIEARRAGA